MHDFGVMALEGERTPYVIPADIDPAHLVQAETIGFGGLDRHRLPPWLERFTRLRHLDLSDTRIKAAQLAPLRRMQRVRRACTSTRPIEYDRHGENPGFRHTILVNAVFQRYAHNLVDNARRYRREASSWRFNHE